MCVLPGLQIYRIGWTACQASAYAIHIAYVPAAALHSLFRSTKAQQRLAPSYSLDSLDMQIPIVFHFPARVAAACCFQYENEYEKNRKPSAFRHTPRESTRDTNFEGYSVHPNEVCYHRDGTGIQWSRGPMTWFCNTSADFRSYIYELLHVCGNRNIVDIRNKNNSINNNIIISITIVIGSTYHISHICNKYVYVLYI